MYAETSAISFREREKFGMAGCGVLRNTVREMLVVDGIRATAVKEGGVSRLVPTAGLST